MLIRAHGDGLIATTSHFDYEVRSATEAFNDVPDLKVQAEMLELALHIIKTKVGKFDPAAFDDRHESALADLVKAKLAGQKIQRRPAVKVSKVVDVLTALRESAVVSGKGKAAKTEAKAAPRKNAS